MLGTLYLKPLIFPFQLITKVLETLLSWVISVNKHKSRGWVSMPQPNLQFQKKAFY